jgi:hypothetical protein
MRSWRFAKEQATPKRTVRVFTADEVALIVAWFGGREERFRAHIEADERDVLNVGVDVFPEQLRAIALDPKEGSA